MSSTNIYKPILTYVLISCLVTSPGGLAVAQTGPNAAAPEGGDPWQRQVACPGASMKVYQPQLDSWTGNKLDAYAAVGVKAEGSSDTAYGVIWFTARTEVDKVNRLVTLDNFNLTKYQFPSVANNGSQYAQAIKANLSWTQKLKNDPPVIIFSTVPAVLALIDLVNQHSARPSEACKRF